MNEIVKGNWKGMEITGKIITGDWEGDPSIPRGINYLDDRVEDLEVFSPDGDQIDDYLTESALEECREILMNEGRTTNRRRL